MGDPQVKEEAEAAGGEWGALGPPCGEVNILYCINASLPSPPEFEPQGPEQHQREEIQSGICKSISRNMHMI